MIIALFCIAVSIFYLSFCVKEFTKELIKEMRRLNSEKPEEPEMTLTWADGTESKMKI